MKNRGKGMQNLAGFASLGAPRISLVETSAPAGDAPRLGFLLTGQKERKATKGARPF